MTINEKETGGIFDVDFASDGTPLVAKRTGLTHDTVTLWNLNLDDLLVRGCEWIQDYLHNPNANLSDEDRTLCDDILNDAN